MAFSNSTSGYSKMGQEAILELIKNMNKSAELDLVNDNDLKNYYDKIKTQMNKLIKIEQRTNTYEDASRRAVAKIDKMIKKSGKQNDSQEVNDSENDDQENDTQESSSQESGSQNKIRNIDFKVVFEEELDKLEQNSQLPMEQHENFIKLMNMTGNQQNDNRAQNDDDELETIEEQTDEIPIDPFTKHEINIPVRNKTCKHIYDQNGFKQVLQSREHGTTHVRCPIVGCNNKRVTINDVFVDYQLRIKYERIKHKKLLEKLSK